MDQAVKSTQRNSDTNSDNTSSATKLEITTQCDGQAHLPESTANQPSSVVTQWTDPYLSRPFIFVLVVSFFIKIVILELLNHLSRKNHGIASVNEDYYYLWTYGPTMSR